MDSPVLFLDDDEREVLSSFIGDLNSRNPYTLDELKKIQEVHCDLMMKLAVAGSDCLVSYLRDTGLGIDTERIKMICLSASSNEIGQLVEKEVHAQWLPKLLEYGEKTANLLRERSSWVLARVQPGRFLITSDSPSVIADLTEEPGSEITSTEDLLHFPVAPDKTILISDHDLRIDRSGLTNRQTRILNCFEMHFAYRWVFSDRNEAFVDKRRQAVKEDKAWRITRHYPRNNEDLRNPRTLLEVSNFRWQKFTRYFLILVVQYCMCVFQ